MLRLSSASAVLAAALLAACGPHGTTLVVVVPGESGHVGGVVVDSGSTQTVLDQPYAATWAGEGGLKPQTLTGEEVSALFAEARDARPLAPVSFTLYFREGSDQFTPKSREVVDEVFAEIARRSAVEISVIGHADRVGYKRDNDRLSRQRAEKVRLDLIKLGIAPQIIRASGRGEREPVVPNPDEKEEPRNRRVEISVR